MPTGIPAAQLSATVADIGNGGGIIPDALLDAIECTNHFPSNDDAYLSLNTITGSPKNKCIQLRALVQNQVLLVLIDSGSSHTFINYSVIPRIQCNLLSSPQMNVTVANGNSMICDKTISGLNWWTQGHTFQVDAKVIPMAAYDLILGMDWLEQFSPMNCDWLEKWIEFDYKDSRIKLQGILPSDSTEVKEISGEQLAKLSQGNDLWAAVLLIPDRDNTTMQEYYMLQGIPQEIQDVLSDFGDLFQKPTELPPSRVYDHSISLLPNTVPVNCRPYRYSPDQKTEIERQVAEMLNSGMVVPSLSPFASPVLLVKKKGWHVEVLC